MNQVKAGSTQNASLQRQQRGYTNPSAAGVNPAASPELRVLAYVHLRNIHGSTGAGRTARQITEHLALRPDVNLHVLADLRDKNRILPLVQKPWTGYTYHTFNRDTTPQQARWFFLDQPKGESFWPEAQIVFCTGESYVPVTGARLVVTAHDAGYFEPGAHVRDMGYWRTRLKWELLYRKLTRKVDSFHTVSAFSAERLAHFFPEIKNRIKWVHNGVTPHFFEPVQPEGRKYVVDAGLSSRPFVLVPGGLHFRKNAELILSAAEKLLTQNPDLIIAVVNHTNPVYAERAQRLGDRMRLLGFVSDEALCALYTAAAVVWYPSRYEGFGLPVVEAMACGASVVCSNSTSIPEVAGDVGVLVDPGDPNAHVNAISDLLTDERTRQQLASAGREHARRFTWGSCAAELTRHFETLL